MKPYASQPGSQPGSTASPAGSAGKIDVGRTALTLVHDLNNALTAILGQGHLALRAAAAGTDVTSHVDQIVRAAERSADLTRRMRALFADSNQGPTSAVPVPRMIVAPARTATGAVRRRPVDGSKTILVVEDDELLRGLVVSLLVANGYSVLEAPLAIEALGLSDGHPGPVAAVVTDVVMPQMHGPEFVAELRRTRPGIRTLYVSGDPEFGGSRSADEAGQSLFLPKPFTADELLTALRVLLDTAPGAMLAATPA